MYNNFIPVFTGGKHTIWGITGIITHLFLQSFYLKMFINQILQDKNTS
ncbi:unnamed protein product [Chrysodeixis includens]|uniref:Uncharacterized protein n=1 Tax=Chrysodeixis includens TaxID=689277 RepID=A0A9N8KSW6_CHRIL|nr:unnamed protein product [Chrysodeixis includens]